MIDYIKGESLQKIWTNIKNYVIAKVSTKADDDEVVKLTGTQTVSGQKTFKNNVIVENSNPLFLIKNSTVNKGTNPSTNVYCGMWLNDKNGTDPKNRVAGLGCEINTAGRYRSYLCVYQPVEGATNYSQISIGYSSDGTITTSTPTPPASDNSSQIANTSWCRANLVTKDGSQTISGVKTFVNGLAFDNTSDATSIWKKIKADKGDILTVDQNFEVLLCDNSGNTNWVNRLAHMRMWYSKDTGNTNISIGAFSSKDNESKTVSEIGIRYDKATDKFVTQAPTPPTGDVSTQIATTAFVNTALNAKDSGAVHKSGNETIKDQKTFTSPIMYATTSTWYGDVGFTRKVPFSKGADISGYTNRYVGFSLVADGDNVGNNYRYGAISTYVLASGDTGAELSAFSSKVTNDSKVIKVGYDRTNDVFFTQAPTPPKDDSTQIATTEWVRALLAEKGL